MEVNLTTRREGRGCSRTISPLMDRRSHALHRTSGGFGLGVSARGARPWAAAHLVSPGARIVRSFVRVVRTQAAYALGGDRRVCISQEVGPLGHDSTMWIFLGYLQTISRHSLANGLTASATFAVDAARLW